MQLRFGDKVRAHFSHVPTDKKCSPESALHSLAKRLIKSSLERAISNQEPYEMSWRCERCGHDHTGDLTLTASAVLLEQGLGHARPDLQVVDAEGRVRAVIEVVVSSKPTEVTRQEYERRRIPLIVVEPSIGTLRRLTKQLGAVRISGAPCKHPKCPDCRELITEYRAKLWNGFACYRCHAPMKVLEVIEKESEMGGLWDKPKGLIPFARDLGVKLEHRYSKTLNGTYPMHVCPKCDANQGDWFVNKVGISWEPTTDEPIGHLDYRHCGDCGHFHITTPPTLTEQPLRPEIAPETFSLE